MDILIRNIKNSVASELNSLADKRGISRNEFICELLTNYVALEEFSNLEDKYITLVKTMAEVVSSNTEELKRVRALLELKE